MMSSTAFVVVARTTLPSQGNKFANSLTHSDRFRIAVPVCGMHPRRKVDVDVDGLPGLNQACEINKWPLFYNPFDLRFLEDLKTGQKWLCTCLWTDGLCTFLVRWF